MKIMIEIDETRYKDIQRIAEVQLEMSHFQTAEQIIAKGVPIEQEQKTGYWIKNGNTLKCPFCGAKGEDIKDDYCFNYCPNCGAKMVKPDEGYANDWIGYSR